MPRHAAIIVLSLVLAAGLLSKAEPDRNKKGSVEQKPDPCPPGSKDCPPACPPGEECPSFPLPCPPGEDCPPPAHGHHRHRPRHSGGGSEEEQEGAEDDHHHHSKRRHHHHHEDDDGDEASWNKETEGGSDDDRNEGDDDSGDCHHGHKGKHGHKGGKHKGWWHSLKHSVKHSMEDMGDGLEELVFKEAKGGHKHKHRHSKRKKVLVGLGVATGVCAVACVALAAWLAYRRHAAAQHQYEPVNPEDGDNSAPDNSPKGGKEAQSPSLDHPPPPTSTDEGSVPPGPPPPFPPPPSPPGSNQGDSEAWEVVPAAAS